MLRAAKLPPGTRSELLLVSCELMLWEKDQTTLLGFTKREPWSCQELGEEGTMTSVVLTAVSKRLTVPSNLFIKDGQKTRGEEKPSSPVNRDGQTSSAVGQ